MSFDTSRFTFRPRRNFLGVVMQQGRVQLDSDWNEWQAEYARRVQAGTVDIIGQAVYPATTPEAFLITATNDANGNHLTIGAGRYYVDGLLAENHGPEADVQWDPALAELSGAPLYSTSASATDFTQQPYLPGATVPTTNGPFLAYLDVWQRDVTYLEDTSLVDTAVGVDTTGRVQTVWQVKLLDASNVAGGISCSTPPSSFPAWEALLQPPAAQLSTGVVPSSTSGPCCLSPNSGYTGLENQFYRIEIHQPGIAAVATSAPFTSALAAGTATFKWSHDNASVATAVSAITTVTVSGSSVSQLTVASLGRDQVLGFVVNDWIEITDDAHELNGQPGEIFQITGVIAATMTITLSGAVSAAFPLTGTQTDPMLHTRIVRWDQSGQVFQTDTSGNTTLWIDLGASGSTGLIPVPPAGTTLVLEDGVTVSFGLSPTTGSFNTGDYWNFDARTADGTVEILTNAPPRGIHHHYAWLSVVTFPTTATNCRIEWPPSATGSSCGCTVNVTASQITGNTTLQSILDQYQNQQTGVTICLAPGTYTLPVPLRLTSAHTNITIEACQPGTVILRALPGNESQFNDGLIVLDGVDTVTLSGLDLLVPAGTFTATTFAGQPVSSLQPDIANMIQGLSVAIGIRLVSSDTVAIEGCNFRIGYSTQELKGANSSSFGAGVFASGYNEGLRLQGNEFIPESKQFARQQDFVTGFLLAPTVAFAPPPPPIQMAAPSEQAKAAAEPAAGSKAAAAKGPVAKGTVDKAAAATGAAVKEEVPAQSSTILQAKPGLLQDAGLQFIGGQFQNIGFNLTPTGLAAAGGSVMAATLDDAVFSENIFIRMNAAALLLGEPGHLDLMANELNGCPAGFWIIIPTQLQSLLLDPQGIALFGATIAMGYPLPQGDTSTLATVAPVPPSVFVYTGASNYTDSNQNLWTPDVSSSSLSVSGGTLEHYTPTITGTSDQALYQSERYGTEFSYTFTGLAPGYYTLTLKFAEIFYTNNSSNKGVRIFDVAVNGDQVLTNFDIVADAGGADIADDQTFSNIAATLEGQIVVTFTGTSNGSDGNAKISAAELDPQWTGNPFLGAGNEGESANFFDQLAQLAQQAYAPIGYSSPQLRIENNEIHALTAPGLVILCDDSIVNDNSSSLIMRGNRIDGEIQGDYYKTFTNQDGSKNNIGRLARFSPFYVRGLYFSLATIVQVSRCILSANMFTSGDPTDGYGISLFLNASPVQQPELAVMGNIFTGGSTILPATRNLPDTTLDPYLQSWSFLNTIIG